MDARFGLLSQKVNFSGRQHQVEVTRLRRTSEAIGIHITVVDQVGPAPTRPSYRSKSIHKEGSTLHTLRRGFVIRIPPQSMPPKRRCSMVASFFLDGQAGQHSVTILCSVMVGGNVVHSQRLEIQRLEPTQIIRQKKPSKPRGSTRRRKSKTARNMPSSEPVRRSQSYASMQNELTQRAAASGLNWEVLPIGWWRKGRGSGNKSGDTGETPTIGGSQADHLVFLDSLEPSHWYVGKDMLGRRRYYVALFPGLAVAESAEYGNALYLLHDDRNWRSSFSMTKRELVATHRSAVTRLVHSGDWKGKLRSAVKRASMRSRTIKSGPR